MRLSRTHQPSLAGNPARQTSRPRWALRALLIFVTFIAVAGLTTAVRSTLGGGSEADASAELSLLREQVSPLLVYSEFGQWADTLWAADPSDPANRAYVGTVEHSSGYGISAGLSPDGAYVAYTVLPREAGREDAAELWLLEVGASSATRLAGNVDLRTTPVWTPASDAVAVRRHVDEDTSVLIQVDLAGNETGLADAAAGLYPIGYSPDGGWLYYATLSAGGTDLARASALGPATEQVAHLSDAFSRDWHLSPDGTALAYLAQASGQVLSYTARVLDVESGAAAGAVSGSTGAEFNPIWHPDGGLTVGRAPQGGSAGAAVQMEASGATAAPTLLPAPATGFDVPLSWSPAGQHLVVRSFEGSSASDPGRSRVVILNAAGARLQLSPLSDVLVVGWLE